MDYIPYGLPCPLTPICLEAAAGGSFQANPTLAAGDVKVYSSADAAGANIDTLPSVLPAAGRRVVGYLSGAETTCESVHVEWIDAAGAEWLPRTQEYFVVPPQLLGLATGFVASAGAATTIDVPAGIIVQDDDYINCTARIVFGTGKGQQFTITDSDADGGAGGIGRITFGALGTAPDNTSIVWIYLASATATTIPVSVTQWNGTAVHATSEAGCPVVTVHTGGIPADAIDSTALAANAATEIANAVATVVSSSSMAI